MRWMAAGSGAWFDITQTDTQTSKAFGVHGHTTSYDGTFYFVVELGFGAKAKANGNFHDVCYA